MGQMTNRPAVATEDGYDAEKLRLCLDSAIEEAAATHAGKPAAGSLERRATSQGLHGSDWRTLLRQIRRERLEEGLRTVHDELLIDALLAAGAPEELQASLARIPAEEAWPRVWQALEQCACDRLALLAHDRTSETFDAALRIWDEAMGLSWPKGSRFPGQLTERVAAMTGIDPGRRLAQWQEQLRKTSARLEEHLEKYPHARTIVAELTRVEAQKARR
jgi:hypothetical protein